MSKQKFIERLNKILDFNGDETHYSIIWKSVQAQRIVLVKDYKRLKMRYRNFTIQYKFFILGYLFLPNFLA